jgi:glutathione S-transferase
MLKIYGVAPSIHTRKVIIAALEKNIQYEIQPVFPFDPPAGWQSLSPTGRIPAVEDDGFALADSSVIVAYLEKKYPQTVLLPLQSREHAQALWVEEYCDGQIAPHVIALFQQRILAPQVRQEPPDESVIADILTNKLPGNFDYLETLLQGEYAVGNSLTIADITIASNLLTYHYLGCALDEKRYPRLIAHFQRMLRRASFQTALKAEETGRQRFGLQHDFLSGIDQ